MSTLTRTLAKSLRGEKEVVRGWFYPLRHRLRLDLRASHDRELVMIFDRASDHGGLVDRIKGVVSAYELAVATNRKLRVYTDETFPLSELLVEGDVDWRAGAEVLRWRPGTKVHISRDTPSPRFTRLRSASSARIFVETNLDYLAALHPQQSKAEIHALWGQRYRELFRPSEGLERDISPLVRSGAVAVHTRFTSLLGDFRDGADRTLPPTERRALLDACAAKLASIAATHRDRTLYVFSDSPTFLARAREVSPSVVVTPGTPVHLERAADPLSTLRKALIDFYVMSRCSGIVQLRLGEMYRSAFSRYASYISGIPFEEVTR